MTLPLPLRTSEARAIYKHAAAWARGTAVNVRARTPSEANRARAIDADDAAYSLALAGRRLKGPTGPVAPLDPSARKWIAEWATGTLNTHAFGDAIGEPSGDPDLRERHRIARRAMDWLGAP